MLGQLGGYVGHRFGICWRSWAYVGEMLGRLCWKHLQRQLFTIFSAPPSKNCGKTNVFLTSPRCNSAPPKGPKPCKKRCFWTQGAKSTVNYRVFWQNRAMYNVFFIFGCFSLAGKLPKWPKIPFQYLLALRYPKILEKSRKHHQGLVSVRNRLWAPPPAKADIATAILTNVIEHLVLLLPPNKHAFTAKAVWADF